MARISIVLSSDLDFSVWFGPLVAWLHDGIDEEFQIEWVPQHVSYELLGRRREHLHPDAEQSFVCMTAEDEARLTDEGAQCEFVQDEQLLERHCLSVCSVVDVRNDWSLRYLAKLRHLQLLHPNTFGIVAIIGVDVSDAVLEALLDLPQGAEPADKPMHLIPAPRFADAPELVRNLAGHFAATYRAHN